MKTTTHWHWIVSCALIGCSFGVVTRAQEDTIKPPPGADQDYEVLTRGQLHEAFATPTTLDPVDQPIVSKRPPDPIDEVLPEHRPDGENVIWIPGYWDYEQQEDDFIWISGLWRNVPPGRQWVPGYWHEVDGGYQWVPGVWMAGSVSFYPEPPASQERGPSSPQPSANHFYIPGCWVYQNNDYGWRPGYWAPRQPGWVWIPCRYACAANGYVYCDGYWDYPLSRRGQLFAPVRFRNQTYARAGYRYAPTTVIDSNLQLLLHLFVRPNRGDYVFGDYYDDRQATPWFDYHQRDRGYDPLFVHYQGQGGSEFVNRMRGWNKYFSANADYRPRPTLTDQLQFAQQHQNYEYLDQSALGNTLERIVSRGANDVPFVPVASEERQALRGVTNQIRALTGQRVQVESAASANPEAAANQSLRLPTETLKLPTLPGVRVPQVGRDVPDIPLNLRNAAPQTPRNSPRSPRTRGSNTRVPSTRSVPNIEIPLNVPGLPF